jgi:anti-sigma regulatory factor (Ser/Thr protein kinase)
MVVPLTAQGRVLGAITLVSAGPGRLYDQQDLDFADEAARRCAGAIERARLFASEKTARQQVVWNLLSNAVKFTPRGGTVRIDVRQSRSAIEIAVADTGEGIAPEFLPHVFEPFRQQEAGTTRRRGGLGRGLAITRQLVELHGGRIEARSDGPGKGATFMSLPVPALERMERPSGAEAAHRWGAAEPDCPPELRGLRVLVVDDEVDSREIVEAVFQDCGSRVTAVAERLPSRPTRARRTAAICSTRDTPRPSASRPTRRRSLAWPQA